MTDEQKEVVLLGARFEILNRYIILSKLEKEAVANAMQVYAELYHIAKTDKI